MARKASKIGEVDVSDASSATAYPMPSNRVADWISSVLAPASCLMGQPSISNIGAGSVARWNPARLLSFGQQTGNAAGGSDFAQSPLAVAYSSAEKMEPAQGNGPVGIIAERTKNESPRKQADPFFSDLDALSTGLGKMDVDDSEYSQPIDRVVSELSSKEVEKGAKGTPRCEGQVAPVYVPCDPDNASWAIMDKFGFRGRLGANEDGIDRPLQVQKRNVHANVGIGAKARYRSNVSKNKENSKTGAKTKTGATNGAENRLEETGYKKKSMQKATASQAKTAMKETRCAKHQLQKSMRRIAKAKDEEGTKNMWSLHLICRFLYFQTVVDWEKVQDLERMKSDQNRRTKAIGECKKLMKRCGSPQALSAKHVYCMKVYHLCQSLFQFDAAEMAALYLGARSNQQAVPVSSLEGSQLRMEYLCAQQEFSKAAKDKRVQSILWRIGSVWDGVRCGSRCRMARWDDGDVGW